VIGNATVPATEITRSFVDVGTVAGVLTSQKKGDEDWFKLGTSDATLNDLATRIATATDRDARAKVADELQSYVLDRGYFVPLTQIVQRVYVQAPEVSGVSYNGLAYAYYLDAWLNS
jgi:peptide/nickel transport system substrate-binding protein